MSEWRLPPGVRKQDNGYYLLPGGEKVHGRAAVDEAVGPRDPNLPDRIAIVAMGISSVDFMQLCAQHGGRSQLWDQVWAINAMAGTIHHDAVFACDPLDILVKQAEEDGRKVAKGMLEWITSHPGPIYTPLVDPRIPGHVGLPVEAIVNDVGYPYINTSVAWAVAYALFLRPRRISLYGCDFTYPNRETAESGRGSVEWLLGIAGERGIQIELSERTTLMDGGKPPADQLYGLDTDRVVPVQGENGWEIHRLADLKAEEEAFKEAQEKAVEEAKRQVRIDFGREAA